MATTKRRSSKSPIGFDSPILVETLARIAYEKYHRWFDHVSSSVLEDFALKYATKTWNVSPTGNDRAIVVSYPRADGLVKMYDLDAGQMFWVPVRKLTKNKISGRARERDYECNDVASDDLRCESEDITMSVDWESLHEFDRGENGMFLIGGDRVKKLIALPRAVKAKRK